jgi:sterol desaturase/sphingolipid hydroxylase (fatty acid hydroxylase superfamily)
MTLKIAMIFFFVMIVLEWLICYFSKKKYISLFDTISGISSGMTNNIKSIFKLSVVIISYQWMVNQFALFEIESTVGLYILAFIGTDFAYYWTHRWNHEINLMWNRHIIHHSSEEYNLACALRQSISGIFQVYFFLYIPLAIIGIPSEVMNLVLPLHLFAQFWYHTRLINKMGFLEKILVTPSHHRVHHAINDEYLDKNYASIFIFWDKIFGTFQPEIDTVTAVYGVKKPVKTWNPLLINFMHLFQLFKDSFRTKKWNDKLKVFYKRTGWRPEDVSQKYPIEITIDPYKQVKYETPSTKFLTLWSLSQLILHFAIQYHIIHLIPHFEYHELIVYALFCMVSIFSYTSLMDRHWLSIPLEIIKLIFGFYLLSYNGEILIISYSFSIDNTIVYGYLFTSFIVTLIFSLNPKRILKKKYANRTPNDD